MITFRLTEHTVFPGKQVVELIEGGKVIATLVNDDERTLATIQIVSAHISGVTHSDNRAYTPPIPSVRVTFMPRPYSIEGDQVVRKPYAT